MSWEPIEPADAYRSGHYEVRLYGDVWRCFFQGRFCFSCASAAEIQRFVAARQAIEIRGEEQAT